MLLQTVYAFRMAMYSSLIARSFGCTCALLLLLSLLIAPATADDFGLQLPPGFQVSLYADNDLAPDVYAMTLDAQGRVVVTSQGYIQTLEDTDGDGRADTATLFATTATGGMGMCFDGSDLYF